TRPLSFLGEDVAKDRGRKYGKAISWSLSPLSPSFKGASMKNYLSLPTIFSFLTAAVLAGACALASPDDKNKKEAPVVPPRKGESETIQLFNCKDLADWVEHENLC